MSTTTTTREYAIDFFESEISGDCPPPDTYTLEVTEVGNKWIERPSFDDPNVMKLNVDIKFRLVDVPDDFSDEEREQWIGWKFSKYYGKPKRLSDERGALNGLIRACMNLPKIEDSTQFRPSELVGKQFRADIEASASGYPRIVSHKPLRRRASAAAPQRRAKPAPVVEQDEEDGWPEDDE